MAKRIDLDLNRDQILNIIVQTLRSENKEDVSFNVCSKIADNIISEVKMGYGYGRNDDDDLVEWQKWLKQNEVKDAIAREEKVKDHRNIALRDDDIDRSGGMDDYEMCVTRHRE